MAQLNETLVSYVPWLVTRRLATNPELVTEPSKESFPTAVLFADISGFTPLAERYAGLAELYFHDDTGWARYLEVIKPDGMDEWVDRSKILVLGGRTEMVGLP